jgi:type IV secretory pathway TraG/TraD family ATPase VirD4
LTLCASTIRTPVPEFAEMDLAFTHGLSGLVLAYATVQAPMLAGLARGGATFDKYVKAPLLALPLTAIAGVGIAAATPLLEGLGITRGGLLHLALGSVAAGYLGYAGGRTSARQDQAPRDHQRGAMLDDTIHESVRAAPNTGISAGKAAEAHITLAGTPISMADESKHFKLIGTTGTGKSTAIREILESALRRGDRAVIADPDAGYLNRFYDADRGDVILNPFDSRSKKWDLFAEIRSAPDVDQLARSLIPDHEGADRSWRGYARTFFSAVTRQAHDAGIDDVSELYRLLVVADATELRALVKGTPAQPFLDEANGRMFDSIRSVASSAVASLDYVAQQRAERFSIRDWVSRDTPGVLFIPYKAGQIASLRSTISAWMRLAIFETMDRDEQSKSPADDRKSGAGSGRLWFVVDELDALGQIDGLKDALARLRKFEGRCVLGFQSIAQVSSTYGQGDAHTVVENCGNTLILRCSASEGGGTARFASQLIGEREVMRTTVSRSRRYNELFGSVSRSEHFSVEPAVLPSQIEQLPDLVGYLKQASEPQWRQVRLDAVRRWNERRQEPKHGPDLGGHSRE